MSTREFDEAVLAGIEALRAMLKGDPEPSISMWSRRDDVTLANPLGPPVVGWANVVKEIRAVASRVASGTVAEIEEVTRFVSEDLGYVVRFERAQVRRNGSDDMTPMNLRVTIILRREEDGWKTVLRHADTIGAAPRTQNAPTVA